jgi:hypothetical protein
LQLFSLLRPGSDAGGGSGGVAAAVAVAMAARGAASLDSSAIHRGAGLQRSGVWGRGVRGGAAAEAQLAAAFVAVQVCSAGGGFGSRVSRLSSMP